MVIQMRNWIVLLITMVVMASFAVGVNGISLRAGESISTDKGIYVAGEDIVVYVQGENNTGYQLYVDGWFETTFITNSTGEAVLLFTAGYGDFSVGKHILQLRLYGDLVATTEIEVRKGLTLWPSKYIGGYTYLNGENLWVKIEGENNKRYMINITNETGVKAYPKNESAILVTTNNSGVAVFNITLNIGDDDYYLNLYNGSKFIQAVSFSVRSVEIFATLDKGPGGVYLLSEKIHTYVSIYWIETHMPIKDTPYRWWIVDATNTSITFGPYASSQEEFDTEPLYFYTSPEGMGIQPNKQYYLKIEFEMNDINGRHYDEIEIPFYTGNLSGEISLSLLDKSLSPGNRVWINVHSYASYLYGYKKSPVENASVKYINITITDHRQVLWNKNYTDIPPTNVGGTTSMLWTVPSVAPGAEVEIRAGISYGDENYTLIKYVTISSDVHLYIYMDKTLYLSGDTMKVEMISDMPEGVSVLGYDIWIFTGSYWNMGKLLYYTSTAKNTFIYNIPLNYSGNLMVLVMASYSDGSVDTRYAYVNVVYGYLDLVPSKYIYFKAGDQITIYSRLHSNVINATTVTYKIYNEKEDLVMQTTVPFGNFTFIIPDGESDYYFVNAEVIDGTYYTSKEIVLYKYMGYALTTVLTTKSQYKNNLYEPGSEIIIAYNITKYGDIPYNSGLMLHWEIVGTLYYGEKAINDNTLTGNITITLPENLDGFYIIKVWVSWYTYDHMADWLYFESGIFPTVNYIPIQIEQGSWSMQDVSGMPIISFLNLVLVILAIAMGIAALVMLFRGGRKEESKKKSAPKPFPVEEEGKEPEIQEENVKREQDEDTQEGEKNSEEAEN